MIAPPLPIESPAKAPVIPRLKLTAPVVTQHQATGSGGKKSSFPSESISSSARENLCSPLTGFDFGVDSHGKHAPQVMTSPSSKDYSFPSTSGQFSILSPSQITPLSCLSSN